MNNQYWFSLILSVALSATVGGVGIVADSIWDNAKGNLYTAERKRLRVGDVVTILISETSSAAQEATTKTSKQSGIGMDILSGWDQVANLLGNETQRRTFTGRFSGNDNYQGSGQTARKSNVRAVVTAVITEILEGGNVYVVGEHKVKVNNEIETIRISGVIRPADITAANTVNSFQIAKAEVSVNGSGVVAAKQSPGVLTKLLGWFF